MDDIERACLVVGIPWTIPINTIMLSLAGYKIVIKVKLYTTRILMATPQNIDYACKSLYRYLCQLKSGRFKRLQPDLILDGNWQKYRATFRMLSRFQQD